MAEDLEREAAESLRARGLTLVGRDTDQNGVYLTFSWGDFGGVELPIERAPYCVYLLFLREAPVGPVAGYSDEQGARKIHLHTVLSCLGIDESEILSRIRQLVGHMDNRRQILQIFLGLFDRHRDVIRQGYGGLFGSRGANGRRG